MSSESKAVLKSMLKSSVEPTTIPDPASIEILFDRINQKLLDGVPESITDEDLEPVVAILRQKRLEFLADNNARPKRVKKEKPQSILFDDL
jgi:hypothetical protein